VNESKREQSRRERGEEEEKQRKKRTGSRREQRKKRTDSRESAEIETKMLPRWTAI
jgi:hypothetical protein